MKKGKERYTEETYAKLRAKQNIYDKEKTTKVGLRFLNTDPLLAYVKTKDNMAGYIKELIRKDMEENGK